MNVNLRYLGRRSFLGVCGGSAMLAYWARSSVGRAAGAAAPKRLVLLHRPNGTISEDWLHSGQRGPILEPFAGVWPYCVALKGVNVKPNGTTANGHEGGLLTQMTGAKLGPTFRTEDDYRSTAESLDQKLLKQSAALNTAPIQSLQLGAHGDQDGGNETPNCTMSYSGPDTPLYPNLNPDQVYSRLFANIMPGGMTDPNMAELAKARARRKSVLDFVSTDLGTVRTKFPTSFKEDLDIHESAIRELEMSLDSSGQPSQVTCTKPTIVAGAKAGGDYMNAAKVGAIQLQLLTAALACDLTRVVTYMWATGASSLSFGPLGANNHNSTSHANVRNVLSAIDLWYSQQTAPFIQKLVDTPDVGGGKLIDNTLVWYLSEVSEGWNHSFTDYPYLFFGGAGVGLTQRGRMLDVSGQGKLSNDVWTTLAPVFGGTITDFTSDKSSPITGLFST